MLEHIRFRNDVQLLYHEVGYAPIFRGICETLTTLSPEPAFSNFRFWMALGFVMSFVWGSFLEGQYHIKVKGWFFQCRTLDCTLAHHLFAQCTILLNFMLLASFSVVVLNYLVTPLDYATQDHNPQGKRRSLLTPSSVVYCKE